MGSGGDVAADSREEIMGATYRALCKHGFAHLTMQDIADEMGKSRPLLHYHYDTKEELLEAFLDHIIGWIGDRLDESDTNHPVDRLAEFIGRFEIPPDAEEEQFALALLELRLQAVHNDSFRQKLTAHYAENVATIEEIIEDGIEAGIFRRDIDARQVGEAIYTAMVGARMYQMTLDAGDATTRMADQLWQWCRASLFAVETANEVGGRRGYRDRDG